MPVATPPPVNLAVVGRPLRFQDCALELHTHARLLCCLLFSWGLGVSFLCVTAAPAPPVGTSLPSLLQASTRRGIT